MASTRSSRSPTAAIDAEQKQQLAIITSALFDQRIRATQIASALAARLRIEAARRAKDKEGYVWWMD